MVSFADITSILGNWLNDYTPCTGPSDANGDGVVNFADITSVLANWLAICPKILDHTSTSVDSSASISR